MKFEEVSSVLLRIGLGLVFIYFSIQQMINPDQWIGFVPEFLTSSVITASNLVIFNSVIELAGGLLLIAGLYTRIASLILGVHLLFITISVGWNPVGVRDFGLTIATLALAFINLDRYCLDSYFSKK